MPVSQFSVHTTAGENQRHQNVRERKMTSRLRGSLLVLVGGRWGGGGAREREGRPGGSFCVWFQLFEVGLSPLVRQF